MNDVQPEVIVIGDVMLDHFVKMTSGHQTDVPHYYDFVSHVNYPGGAANVAMNVASLGAVVRLYGIAGFDEEANTLLQLVNAGGVQVRLSGVRDLPTTRKIRLRAHGSTVLRVSREGGVPVDYKYPLIDQITSDIFSGSSEPVVVFSDYGKGMFVDKALWEPLVRRLNANNVNYLVDPYLRDDWRLWGGPAAIFKANRKQALALIHEARCIDRIDRSLADWEARRQLALVLGEAMQRMGIQSHYMWLTFGENGSILLLPNDPGSLSYVRPYPSCGIDVNGCGDTAIAALATYLAKDLAWRFKWTSVMAGCTFASKAAAIAADREGTVAVTLLDTQLCKT